MAGWDESKHPRVPGGEHGGEFTHTAGAAAGWVRRAARRLAEQPPE